MRREIRTDPTTGQRVIFAPERLLRPKPGGGSALPAVAPADCPFCIGHESSTTPTIQQLPATGPWNVRAFANRFPALTIEGDPAGAHEVIVECTDHSTPLWHQDAAQLTQALTLAQARMRDLSGDTRFEYFAWFRNHGVRAGASQAHPHSQLVALPYVPDAVGSMMRAAHDHGFERIVDHARVSQRLLIDGAVLALCPYAPTFPFETWLIPGASETDFRDADAATLSALGACMKRILGAMAQEIPEFAYCAVMYTRPSQWAAAHGFRWHIRIQPRPEIQSGFFSATGDGINGVLPEVAAERLGVLLASSEQE